MIYKIEKGTSVFKSNEGLDSNAVFSQCVDRELKYVFLLHDIDSPYIKMRYKDRVLKAAAEAGYRKEAGGKRFDKNARAVISGGSARVKAAITEFLKIQKASNTNYSVLTNITTQIDRTMTYLESKDISSMTVKEMLELNKLATSLQDLIATKINIEAILNIDGSGEDDEADKIPEHLSMLDQINLEQED